MGAFSAAAQENVTIDDINYYLYNDEATIMVQPRTLAGNIVIPATVNHNGDEYEVVRIGDSAFEWTDITGIELPEGITALGKSCFTGCNKLTSITLKGEVTTIGNFCFYSCDGLTSLDFLPQSVTTLGSHCFENCSGLIAIEIPNNVTTLGSYCFNNCSNLTDVTLPNSLKTIPEFCFTSSGLKSITLPASLERLELSCFYNCASLVEVICPLDNLDNVTADDHAFDGIFSEATLRVPKGTADIYRAKSPWNTFKYIVEMDEEAEDAEPCATPTIAFEGKKLTFSSATDGAKYHYTIADNDVKTEAYSKDGVVELDAAYEVKVYASANGYKNSDMAYATIFFIDQAETATGLTFAPEQRGVMVTNDGRTVTVSGLEDGERVELYAVDGTLLDTGAAVAAGTVSLDAGQATGVVIVKAGQSSMKVSLR